MFIRIIMAVKNKTVNKNYAYSFAVCCVVITEGGMKSLVDEQGVALYITTSLVGTVQAVF